MSYLCAGATGSLVTHLPEVILAATCYDALGWQHSLPAASMRSFIACWKHLITLIDLTILLNQKTTFTNRQLLGKECLQMVCGQTTSQGSHRTFPT